MKFRKRILNGVELAHYCIKHQIPGENTIDSPWPGLVIKHNNDFTGFTVINESNTRDIAYINLLSAYGKMYTAYRLLSLPASYQKKDQQCVPIEMGKPECGKPVSCKVRPVLHNASKYKTTEWIGGRSGQAGYPLCTKYHRGVLIYDEKGILQTGGMSFDKRLTYGAEGGTCSDWSVAPLWLHGLPNKAVSTVKEWYASIYETIDKIEGCDASKRGMLTLAAKTYTAYYNASKKIVGSKLIMLPMTYNESNNSPWGKGNFSFGAADHMHYLGVVKKNNWCKLPKIALVKQSVIRDETCHVDDPDKVIQLAHDVLIGEIAVIPPFGCYGLKWKTTSSVGDRGTSGLKNQYTSLSHAELCRNDDDYLRMQGGDLIDEKYSALKEPWRDFLALKHNAPEEQELSTYNRSVDKDDLETLLVRSRQRNHVSYTKEQVIRGLLHDFSAEPDYVAVKKILVNDAADLPRAVHVDNLANSMVAEQVVNQLPLS